MLAIEMTHCVCGPRAPVCSDCHNTLLVEVGVGGMVVSSLASILLQKTGRE